MPSDTKIKIKKRPAPKIKVKKLSQLDFKPFEREFRGVRKSIKGIKIPEPFKANKTKEGTLKSVGLVDEDYDYIEIAYMDGNPTTIIYRRGGEKGLTIATLKAEYDGDKLVAVQRS